MMGGNNKSPIPESTSRRITSLRFLLIVLVVFIHNNFTQGSIEEVAAGGTYILFNQNLVGKWVQLFISDGIACAAVPLFFLFAAYLQAKKADSYGTLLRKKAKSLLVPYIIWISLYVFYLAGLKLLVIKIAPGLIAKPEKNALSWTAADWLQQTLGYRATANGMLTFPWIAPHFWFIRDLIILTALSPVLQFLARRFPAAFLGLVSVAFFVPLNVYFVRDSQALFFYALGLLWGIHDIPLFEKIDQICIQGGVLLFLMTFLLHHTLFKTNVTMYLFMIIFACVIMLRLSAFIAANDRMRSAASYLAGFSFFLFAIHSPILNELLKRTWLRFFPMRNGFFCLFEYFGVSALTVIIGTAAGIALKKICPPLFRLLTGGR